MRRPRRLVDLEHAQRGTRYITACIRCLMSPWLGRVCRIFVRTGRWHGKRTQRNLKLGCVLSAARKRSIVLSCPSPQRSTFYTETLPVALVITGSPIVGARRFDNPCETCNSPRPSPRLPPRVVPNLTPYSITGLELKLNLVAIAPIATGIFSNFRAPKLES